MSKLVRNKDVTSTHRRKKTNGNPVMATKSLGPNANAITPAKTKACCVATKSLSPNANTVAPASPCKPNSYAAQALTAQMHARYPRSALTPPAAAASVALRRGTG